MGDDCIFHAGPSVQMNWIDTSGAGSNRTAGLRAADQMAAYGNAVMVAPNKILTLGGATASTGAWASKQTHLITLSGEATCAARSASVAKLGNLAFQRAYSNAVVLPDGSVVVIGGQLRTRAFTDDRAVLPAEMWTPNAQFTGGTWSTLAAMKIPRCYHSTALLLPDARVISCGGGLCGKCAAEGGWGRRAQGLEQHRPRSLGHTLTACSSAGRAR